MEKFIWDSLGSVANATLFPGVCFDSQNNKIYIFGGNISKTWYQYYTFYTPVNTLSQIQEIDVSNKSTRTITMNYPTMGSATGYYNGYIYSVGGFYGNRGQILSSNRWYQMIPRQVVYKYKVSDGVSSTTAEDITTFPINLTFPAYVQIDNLLYIFGGGNAPNVNTNNGTSDTIRQIDIDSIEQDVRHSYILDMEKETIAGLPYLPIHGGLCVKCCYDGNKYIYIRSEYEFCRLNIRDLSYEILPSFKRSDYILSPEIYFININNKDYVVTFSGTSDNSLYSQAYDVLENKIIEFPENSEVGACGYYTSNLSNEKIMFSFGGSSKENIYNSLAQFKKEVV